MLDSTFYGHPSGSTVVLCDHGISPTALDPERCRRGAKATAVFLSGSGHRTITLVWPLVLHPHWCAPLVLRRSLLQFGIVGLRSDLTKVIVLLGAEKQLAAGRTASSAPGTVRIRCSLEARSQGCAATTRVLTVRRAPAIEGRRVRSPRAGVGAHSCGLLATLHDVRPRRG